MTWRLAWRGLLRNPRRTFVVIAAVAIGIFGCFLAIAVNSGLAVQMVDSAIETGLGHVQVHAAGFADSPKLERVLPDGGEAAMVTLAKTAGVRGSARRVRGQGLLSSPRASVGVEVIAIEYDREPDVSSFERSLVKGAWLSPEGRSVVIGRDLAEQLRVELGSKIVLSVQDISGDLTGNAYRVAGLFHTSSREVNQRSVLMHLSEAQALFGLGDSVSEVVVVASKRRDVGAVRDALIAALDDDVEVKSWEELEPLLVYFVALMDQMAWMFYAGVFVAMTFGIANVLLMSVYERTREIGVMMAMGMRSRLVVTSVVVEAQLVTVLGLALGMGLGWLSVVLLADGIPLGAMGDGLDQFGIQSRIVPVLRANDIVAPLVLALVASCIASAWPALRAAALRPSEALRRT